ncbi:Transcription elongation factor 1 [Wickerhamiella sorbophila]|uniref:Transcription elongation factor 1 homolog n=1 Tax=Wickerhamiella sorbophila TaxID=45607 RepID=A0A2T0FEA7_9ASCO|nr:Transcription elongation factor 1 [Wickerhamiella sorbophila]PRT53315.1 Transcription elongation factor 1 [Wickerhamiella sorbophila]
MGKRKKSSRGPQKKLKQVLPTTFTCLFCNHEDSVVCVMDKRLGIGTLNCKVCGQNFQASINALSAPIDVYTDWFDACEAVAAKKDDAGEDDIDNLSDADEDF